MVSGSGRKKARLLSGTDHISLFGAGSLRIVRVGPAGLEEEAWWRYGRQLSVPSMVERRLPRLSRMARLGDVAWRGEKACPGCGHTMRKLLFSDRKTLVVRPGQVAGSEDTGSAESSTAPPGPPSLTGRCPRCRDAQKGGLHLRGTEAELTLARVLAYDDLTGASFDRVRAAARLVQDPDGPRALVRILTSHGQPLGGIPPIGILALEITTMDAREGRILKLELEELRFRWRQEEELAALIDGDLTPMPLLGSLIRRVRGGG